MTLACAVTLALGPMTLEVRFESAHHVTGLFGPSGAGKTSLLECIIGLRRAAGTIRLGDRVFLDDASGVRTPPELRDIGYVPQGGLLFPHLSARANVLTGRRRARARGVDVDRTFASVVDVLGIEGLLDRPVSVLSGGEKQRVALARALCSGPRLLAMDEPLASLDVGLQRRLLPYLRRVRDEFDVPMLLVSHSPLEIQTLCDHVIALREGRIVAEGAPADVLSRPEVLAGSPGEILVSVLDVVPTDGAACVKLRGTDVTLTVRGAPIRGPSLVSVPADAVMLAIEEPTGISAANVLEGRIVGIDPCGELAIARVAVADEHPPLLAELTRSSLERLGLMEGLRVFAIVKATACTVFDERA